MGIVYSSMDTMYMYSTNWYYKVLLSCRVLRVLYSTHWYCSSTHGYYGTIGTTEYYGYYVVPKTGYYRVLQAYAAEGMSRVRLKVGLRACTHLCTTYECIAGNIHA